ncbi:hypothetical protein ACHAWU_004669 [Discostella pseudostelligera]|uniref:Histone deacetylase domain-containing protein n=1 Tax=Discostella pseudostelligera TaxID=259834 RepID=A0ABD3NAS6_9STRA
MTMTRIRVVSAAPPPPSASAASADPDSNSDNSNKNIISSSYVADTFDRHNRPRTRRNIILTALQQKYSQIATFCTIATSSPPSSCDTDLINLYSSVHDVKMIKFLVSAWSNWMAMGPNWDKDNCHPEWSYSENNGETPPLVPIHSAFRRDHNERPSTNVMGAIGYYCTDFITPIVGNLVNELIEDANIICTAVRLAFRDDDNNNDADNNEDAEGGDKKGKTAVVAYAVTTHPGHHASYDCFGGYCYLNNAALCARLMQHRINTGKSINIDNIIDGESIRQYWESTTGNVDKMDLQQQPPSCRVAILDVDYHVGNGTASIFYHDPHVFVISIHCDPEIDYPWNSGFADQIGACAGVGKTLHIPLQQGASWEGDGKEGGAYKVALDKAMSAIVQFDPHALVVSLGLDTYDGDNVAVNRGGFKLKGTDYYEMGKFMGKFMKGRNVPCVFVQEGGYKMDVVGDAAADVVGGYAVGVEDGATV